MSTSLSSLADTFSEIYNKKFKECIERKKKLNQYAILLDLKIINYLTKATNARKR